MEIANLTIIYLDDIAQCNAGLSFVYLGIKTSVLPLENLTIILTFSNRYTVSNFYRYERFLLFPMDMAVRYNLKKS